MSCMNRRASIVLGFLIFLAAPLAAQDVVGEVVFVDGYPQFVRDGVELAQTVDFGYPVENFDTVITDDSSSLEISIHPDTGIDLSIVVDPQTRFYLDLSSYQQRQRGVVELITGSINVTAREIREGSGFIIHTPTSSMGVRGTVFSVTTSPGGEILVLPDEGVVEVNTISGQRGFARSGEAVEIDTVDAVVRTLRFDPAARSEFRERWRSERREALVARAPDLVRRLGLQYRDFRDRFVSGYSELMRQRTILDQWMEEARRGTRGEPTLSEQQVQTLAPVLLRLRTGIRAFEQLYSQLEQLRGFLPEGAGALEVEPGVSVADVYRSIGDDRAVMQPRFYEVRHALKLFASRNGGIAPRSILGQESGVRRQ